MHCSSCRVSHGCSQGSSSEPCFSPYDERKDYQEIEEKTIREAVLATDWIDASSSIREDVRSKIRVQGSLEPAVKVLDRASVIVPKVCVV